jgi:hypothetical protein
MFLLLSGNDDLCREIVQAQIETKLSYSNLAFPLSLKPFEIWENSILEDLDSARPPVADTLRSYTRHIGMTGDKSRSIAILERVSELESFAREGDRASEASIRRNAWVGRLSAAYALIELGAVERGRGILDEMTKSAASEREYELLARPARPTPRRDKFICMTDIDPKPGKLHDPKSAGFKALDGMGEVRRLLANHETERAAGLFHDIRMRILLDHFPNEKITVRRRTHMKNSSARASESADAIPVIAALYWNLDAPFLGEYALDAWRGGMDCDPEHLAPLLAHNGDLQEARIAALELQRDGESNDLESIRMLPAIDGLTYAGEGRVDAALDRLDVCMNLSPFDPRSGMAILRAFQKRRETGSVDQAAERIRQYWKQRLAEYPDSSHVLQASSDWLGELERNL